MAHQVASISNEQDPQRILELLQEYINDETHDELLLRGVDFTPPPPPPQDGNNNNNTNNNNNNNNNTNNNNKYFILIVNALKELVSSRIWESFEISDCTGPAFAVAVAHGLQQNTIKTLKINDDGENLHGCFVGLGTNTTLKQLRITSAWTSSSSSTSNVSNTIDALAQAIATNVGLTTLDFRWSSFEEPDTITTLAKGLSRNQHLRNLHFSGCGLDDNHVNQIVDALQQHPTLEMLDLSGNKCESLPMLIIPKKLSNLQCLDLGFQRASSALSTTAPASDKERRLNVTSLTKSLHANSSLKIIKLSENALDDDDAEQLALALSHNASLQELHLARNKITDKGIIKLAQQFPKMKGLKKLSLWGNQFGEIGAKALLEGLERNVELEDLDLFRNFSVTPLILHHTWINRGGRRIFQNCNPNEIPLALWPHLLERINLLSFPRRSDAKARADVMYYMLQGPALLDRFSS